MAVAIDGIQWVGLRCRVSIKPPIPGLAAALRSKPNDAASNLCVPKPFDSDGRAGLLVEDEGLSGVTATLVVSDGGGRILCKQHTTVGGES